MVDIELRQAPLISEHVRWCSNLAAPDMLLDWSAWMPAFVISWLGPYFNILPVLTIALFIAQQKMFMPPPTDDQSRMQQKIMKYMMVFMGFIFFKVASGLCIYFIASSLWGLAERKLLPKPAPKTATAGKDERARPKPKPAPKPSGAGGNGAPTRKKKGKKNRSRR
jgi:YidC/Oxa1 family membrane protein insertase